eukprot:scaffold7197_cov88-Skeletonema_menzelii.AAC.25
MPSHANSENPQIANYNTTLLLVRPVTDAGKRKQDGDETGTSCKVTLFFPSALPLSLTRTEHNMLLR